MVYRHLPVRNVHQGVTNTKLHRDVGVAQRTAWFMLHRLRKAWSEEESDGHYDGLVEMDEVYVGRKERNKHWDNRLNAGRGAVGKTAIIGVKDRDSSQITARAIENVTHDEAASWWAAAVDWTAELYTDESSVYIPLPNLSAVNHSRGQFVRGDVHTKCIESFRSLLRRGFHRTYHRRSTKHVHRYVDECTGRRNIRDKGAIDQMRD